MNINHNHILSLLQTGFTTIAVSFEVGMNATDDPTLRARNRNTRVKEYTYKALESDNLKVGDLVVVDSPSEGFTIVEVTRVDAKPRIELDAPFAYKWIVQKIDRSRYDNLLAQEAEFKEALVEVERVKQRETVMKSFQEVLPEGSEARKLFETTIEAAKVLPHAG